MKQLSSLPGIWVFLLAVASVACSASQPEVELRGQRFVVELATSREDQARGLMFRDELARNTGMLFIFPRENPRSFWMKNTRIPLDILYFDRDLRLVSVSENARPCVADPCPNYPSEGPSMYVLELNAGRARELGVEQGDELILNF